MVVKGYFDGNVIRVPIHSSLPMEHKVFITVPKKEFSEAEEKQRFSVVDAIDAASGMLTEEEAVALDKHIARHYED